MIIPPDNIFSLWIIMSCLYGIFWLRRYYLDKKDSFEKYILMDLKSNGFILVASRFIINRTPKPIEGYKHAIHPANAGSRIVSNEGYKIFRTVIIKDGLGTEHELLAAIEFDDRSLLRRFKGVSWTPELSTISQQPNQPFRKKTFTDVNTNDRRIL